MRRIYLVLSGFVPIVALTLALAGYAFGGLEAPLGVAPAAAGSISAATPDVDTPGNLLSYRTGVEPAMDGQVDAVWSQAPALAITMTHGLASTECAPDLLLRSLHTDTTVYFLAQWPGNPPPAEDSAIFNMLTVHWSIPQPDNGLQPFSCAVACHTGYANTVGRFVSTSTVTIPQGGRSTLPAGGGWQDGMWTLVWSRPLASPNPYDVQFTDQSRGYSFFVKVFQRVDGSADPISQQHLLVFQP